MRRSVILPMLLLLSLTLTSCWVYKPQLADIPLIDHKGDIRINGSVYFNPIPVYSDRLGSYFYPALGISSSFSAGVTESMAINTYIDYQLADDFYTHFALGWYKSYKTSVFEGYLGTGFGHGSIHLNAYPASSSIYYVCPFVQLNYGWHLGPHWDIGVSLKAGDYTPFKIKIRTPEDYPGPSHVPLASPLLEPQVFFRVGNDKCKFQSQIGYTYIIGWPNNYVITYHHLSIGMGVSIAL